MVHLVRPILRGRGGMKWFLVHFVASAKFDVYTFLRKQVGKRDLYLREQRKGAVQTIEIRVKESRLLRMLDLIPRTIQLAYEQKEPDC